ncbi:MAG: hypothetical protein QG663_650 [Thermodesulfobacteriota bacterium]|jgi:hypothetical protein|nr:hypothetical protein [Thermodesulfobacteriota bacterium]
MKTLTLCYVVFLAIAPIMILNGTSAHAEDLLVKSCSELVRMAENLQEDLKTVDIVLGSAIEAGKMDSIKNFKIKKAGVQQQIQSVMNAIEVKSCIKTKQ